MAEVTDGLKNLIRGIYEKENPEKAKRLNDDVINNIVTTYNGDHRQITKAIYDKENPEKAQRINEDVYSNIEKTYGLGSTQPTVQPQTQELVQAPGQGEDLTYMQKQLREKGLIEDQQPTVNIQTEVQQEQPTSQDQGGYLTELGKRATRGANQFNQMLVNTPNTFMRVINAPFNELYKAIGLPEVDKNSFNKITGLDKVDKRLDQYNEALTKRINLINPKSEQGLIESAKKGEWGTFARNLSGSVVESMPTSIGIMATAPAGGAALTTGVGSVVFGSAKLKEIDEQAPDLPEGMKLLTSITNGALEGLFESTLGSGAVSSAMVDLVTRSGRRQAEQVIKGGLRDGFSKLLTKYPMLAPFGEGYEEWATQVTQNYIDKITGYKPDVDIFEGALDNMLVGMASGGTHTIPLLAAQKYAERKGKPIPQANEPQQAEQPQENITQQPVSPDTQQRFTVSPRQTKEAEIRQMADQIKTKDTGTIKIVEISNPEGTDNSHAYVVATHIGLDGKAVYRTIDDNGVQGWATEKSISGEPQEIDVESFVAQNLGVYDQQEQANTLAQQNQMMYQGQLIERIGENIWQDENYNRIQLPEEEYQAWVQAKEVDPNSNPDIVTQQYGKTKVTGTKNEDGSILISQPATARQAEALKAEVEESTGGNATVQAELIPNEDATAPQQFQLSIIPKVNEPINNESVTSTPSGDNGLKADPTEELYSEPQSFNSQIPKKKVGNKEVTDYESAPAQTTLGALVEDFQDQAIVDELIDSKISDLESQIIKIGKVKVIPDIDQYKQNLREVKGKTDEVTKQLEYWKSVKAESEQQKANKDKVDKEQKQAETDTLLDFIDEFNATPQSREDKQQASAIELEAKRLGYMTGRNAMNKLYLYDGLGEIKRQNLLSLDSPKTNQNGSAKDESANIVSTSLENNDNKDQRPTGSTVISNTGSRDGLNNTSRSDISSDRTRDSRGQENNVEENETRNTELLRLSDLGENATGNDLVRNEGDGDGMENKELKTIKNTSGLNNSNAESGEREANRSGLENSSKILAPYVVGNDNESLPDTSIAIGRNSNLGRNSSNGGIEISNIEHSATKQKIHDEFDVDFGEKTILTGSVFRGEAREDSDIDIIISGMPHDLVSITPLQARENSNYAYNKLLPLLDSGIIENLSFKSGGNMGVTFNYKGQEFQVSPNPTNQNIQQNEKPVENVSQVPGQINQLQGEDTPQAQQGEGISEGLEENVSDIDPDLQNINPTIIAARNGDKQAQEKLEEYGLEWEQTTTYRFVGQSEVDVLLSNNNVESKRFSDAGIDVTTSPNVTSAADSEYRVTFKESFDINNGLNKVRVKSREEGDHNLEKGRGYSLNDVSKIERIDENGNVTETIYDAKSAVQPISTGQPATVSQTADPVAEEIAGQEVNLNPSEAQKKAGNYKMAHIQVQGMDITIENPKGSIRKGTDEDGKAWEQELQSHYGYFKRTNGKDGDHVDTFIGENPESNWIFVVDQNNPKSGEFDESKVMLGFNSIDEAKSAYLSNYEPGWNGLRNITAVPVDQFKEWLYDGARQRKPFVEYKGHEELLSENNVDTSVPELNEEQINETETVEEKETEIQVISELKQEKKANSDLIFREQKKQLLDDLLKAEDILLGNNVVTGRAEHQKVLDDKELSKKLDTDLIIESQYEFTPETLPAESIAKLNDLGIKIVDWNLGSSTIKAFEVDVYKDGSIKVASIRTAINAINKRFPMRTPEKNHLTNPATLKGKEKAFLLSSLSEAERLYKVAQDNLEQANKSGLKGMISVMKQNLEDAQSILDAAKRIDYPRNNKLKQMAADKEFQGIINPSKGKAGIAQMMYDFNLDEEQVYDIIIANRPSELSSNTVLPLVLADALKKDNQTVDQKIESIQKKIDEDKRYIAEKKWGKSKRDQATKYSYERSINAKEKELDTFKSNRKAIEKVLSPVIPQSENKEPWQMTFNEYLDENLKRKENDPKLFYNPITHKYESQKSVESSLYGQWSKLNEQAFIDGKSNKKPAWARTLKEHVDLNGEGSEQEHKLYIEQAISEGKPVPQEVLNDYPELQKSKPLNEFLSDSKKEVQEKKQSTPLPEEKQNVDPIKKLESENKSTLPKIPVGKIFSNDVQAIPREARAEADKLIESNTFDQLPVETVNVSDIIPTQKNVTIPNIKEVANVDLKPQLLKFQGKYYVLDGHHRIANRILEGETTVEANVFDEDARIIEANKPILNKEGKISKDESKPEKIEDFGEKILGAKKDRFKEMAKMAQDATVENLIANPLSKVFPEPDYKKLIESGELTPSQVSAMKVFREQIPSKPKKAYKVRRWAEQANMYIGLISDLASKNGFFAEAEGKTFEDFMNRFIEKFPGDLRVANEMIFKKKFYDYAGPEYNASNYQFRSFVTSEGRTFGILTGSVIKGRYNTEQEAFEALKNTIDGAKGKAKSTKFSVYLDTKTTKHFIGYRAGSNVVRIKEGFEPNGEAMIYLSENQAELEQQLQQLRDIPDERKASNSPRIGTDYRNGKDVTPELFNETFGFRGVQFGNYVENDRRIQDLNEAYDALMDLANILNIPAKAISLNGELGMAFGARGSGKYAAHYESGQIVINITKTRGAGSLAHEWFHAVDNYFERARGNKHDFVTDFAGGKVYRHGKKETDNKLRIEVLQAFADLNKAIEGTTLYRRSRKLDATRSKPYWGTTIEVNARAFEWYVKNRLMTQGAQNDYLANIQSEEHWDVIGQIFGGVQGSYPYPTTSEAKVISDAFDHVFDVIETKDENGQVPLFRILGETGAGNLDKAEEATTRLDNLKVAREMEQAGKDVKSISLATGWEKGVDGLWRYEVPDNFEPRTSISKSAWNNALEARKTIDELNAKKDYETDREGYISDLETIYDDLGYKMWGSTQDIHKAIQSALKNNDQSLLPKPTISGNIQRWAGIRTDGRARLVDVIDNDQLFTEYPFLKNVRVSFENTKDSKGAYNPKSESIVISDHYKHYNDEVKSTLLHEVQHAIQYKEGFAKGGNTEMFTKSKQDLAKEQWAGIILETVKDGLSFEQVISDLKKEVLDRHYSDNTYSSYDFNAILDFSNSKDLESEVLDWNEKSKRPTKDPLDQYKRLAGEVESRNVQTRMNFTPEQRRNALLSETEDVSREDQIVLMDGMGVSSLEEGNSIESTIDFLQSNDPSKKEVHFKTKNEIVAYLEANTDKFAKKTIDNVKKTNFSAIQIDDEMFFNSDEVKDTDDVVRDWVHERTHAQVMENLPNEEQRNEALTELYNFLGQDEVRRIVPIHYWKEKEHALGNEYLAHAAQQLATTGEIDSNIDPEIRDIITNIVNQFTTIKTIQDAKNIRTDISNGKESRRNENDGSGNGREVQPSTSLNGREGNNTNASLRSSEGKGTKVDRTQPLLDYLSGAKDRLEQKKNIPVELNSPEEIEDKFFTQSYRPVLLPSLPKSILDAMGIEDKPVLIKRNIFTKNRNSHKELSPEDSRYILNNALYHPDIIGKSQPKTRENYWVAVKLDRKNAVVVIEINPTKENNEVVGWRYTDEKGLAKLKRQAEREDGQLLIQTPDVSEAAAALSTLPLSLPNKDIENNSKIPNTILINGVSRSTLNSNGKPIANSEEGIRNFYKWFQNSKVVDSEGRPLVVYHGTGADFSEFKNKYFGGYYFAKDPNTAAHFADLWYQQDQNIIPAYINIQNPFILDFKGEDIGSPKELIDAMEAQNELHGKKYDGAIYKNVSDNVDNKVEPTDVFVALKPNQIKSSTGNNGSFDPTNNNINFKKTVPLNDFLANASKNNKKKFVKDGAKMPDSVNSDVDKNMKSAHGLRGESILDKLKRWGGKVREQARHFEHIREADYPAVYNKLRILESIPDIVKKEAYDKISTIIRPIVKTKNYYEAFERFVVLNDLMSDINKGLYDGKDLPWGYNTQDEVRQDAINMKKYVNENPDVKKVIEERNAMMRSIRDQLIKAKLLDPKAKDSEAYFHHQVLQFMESKPKNFPGLSISDARVKNIGAQKGRVGSAKAYNTNYIEAEFEVIAQTLEQLETRHILDRISDDVNIFPNIFEQAQNEGENWKSIVPEGYVKWYPKKGTNAYKAASFAEKALTNALESPENVETVLEMTAEANNSMWVIPADLAKQLDSMKVFEKENPISQVFKGLTTGWKQYILFNPYRAAKYMVNNLSGDIDIVLAYDPRVLKYVPDAVRELYANAKGSEMSADIQAALHNRVIGSGVTVNEIQDINKEGVLKMIQGSDYNLIRKYFSAAMGANNFRENTLRLAAYKYFKDKVDSGKNVYGASKKKSIDAIIDKEEKAGRLAVDLLGDYGNISQAGVWMREHVFPFWSWVEVNSPRYYHLLRNTRFEDGKTLAAVGARKTGINVVKYGLKASILMALVVLWNRAFFPDEDDEISQTMNDGKLYLILGRTDEGDIRMLKVTGSLSDMLSYAGLDNVVNDVNNISKGKSNIGREAKEAGKAIVNKFTQGAMPLEKTAVESIIGKSMYPDIFQPRQIRDAGEHISRVVSMDKVYKLLTNKPMKGLSKEMQSLLLYNASPGEAAYYAVREKVYDFLDEKGIERLSGEPTKKSNTLYYYKQALKYGDEELAKDWLKKYYDLGGTEEGMRRSIDKGEVLSPIPTKFRNEFIKTLDKDDIELINISSKWYDNTYK